MKTTIDLPGYENIRRGMSDMDKKILLTNDLLVIGETIEELEKEAATRRRTIAAINQK